MTISNLEDQLRRDEGWRGTLYPDTVGKWTIGYGRNLSDTGISPDEGVMMLRNDIRAAQVLLESYFPWTETLDSVRQGVLLNMVYNLGIAGLAGFKDMLSKVHAGEFKAAGYSMLNSKWAGQVGTRAQRLAIQMETGEWQ